MARGRTNQSLGSSSFVLLGMLAIHGPLTTYDIKRLADTSIGYFWDFPQSQLYAEADRLTELGLVSAHQEDHGRRRRVLTIEPTGRNALAAWIRQPAQEPTEVRDLGLLQLFFSEVVDDEARVTLATAQLAAHRTRLAEYQKIDANVAHIRGTPTRATLELGLRYERAAVAFWKELVADPPRPRTGP